MATAAKPDQDTQLSSKQSKASAKAGDEAIAADKRFKALNLVIKRHQNRQDELIEILHRAQEIFGYLEEKTLVHVARSLKLPASHVLGVATFYHLFSLKPSGDHTCVVCLGTACYVRGGGDLLNALEQHTGIKSGATTEDGKVSLVTARCIGACGIAPAVVFDGQVAAQVTAEQAIARVSEWQASP